MTVTITSIRTVFVAVILGYLLVGMWIQHDSDAPGAG